MGILEVLTIIFIVLKLVGVITWSWWIVFLPTIISVSIYVIIVTIHFRQWLKLKLEIDKAFDDDFFK